MRAVLCRSYGAPEDLVIEEVPDPVVGPGQLLVRVRAAAVNFPDVLLIAGKYQITIPVPFVPGSELAGEVVAVGDGAPFSVGQRVSATTAIGGFAEQAVLDARAASPIPEGVDFASAAAFGVTYRTAYHALRTVADVRHAFTKYGGNLGTDGSVAFMFKHCGQLVFAPGTSEDKLMEAALDAGAEDVITNDDGSLEVITGPHDFSKVKVALEEAGFKPEIADVLMKPATEIELNGDDAVKMQKLLDALEAVDDVQEVYTSAVMDGGQ